jgi:hypothetical protein
LVVPGCNPGFDLVTVVSAIRNNWAQMPGRSNHESRAKPSRSIDRSRGLTAKELPGKCLKGLKFMRVSAP